jgi:lipid II:glycine glycyltransferase (peptidoglycan interpeptide bridge formation enzyme)
MKSEKDNYTYEVDNISKRVWSGLLEHFRDASIYQTTSYGDVHWGRDNLNHFVLKKGDEILGIAQVYVRKIPVLKVGVAYIYWGPLWRRKGEEDKLNNLNVLLRYLKLEYAKKKGLFLRIVPRIVQDDMPDAHQIFADNGFVNNTSIPPYRTFLVDLTPPLDTIRKSLDQKWRNQLNRAEKNEMGVIEGKSDDLYDIFLTLQKEMLDRKSYLPGVDYNEFKMIQQDLPVQNKMNIFICQHENESVTATISSAGGDTGIYLLGATGDKGLKAKGAYLAQWLVICWLKKMGLTSYDLGGINPDSNPGVYHFKSGLKGRDVKFLGTYEACENILSSWLMKIYMFWSARKQKQSEK